MSISRILKWVTGGLEAVLGIPFVGGSIVLGLFWAPLAIMLILHIITLVMAKQEEGEITGSILGVITSCIAWIPFVGMTMHIISAIFLMVDASKPNQEVDAA